MSAARVATSSAVDGADLSLARQDQPSYCSVRGKTIERYIVRAM